MKKMILLVLSVVAMALSASAQHAVGDWRIHTSFVGDQVKSIAESRQWVYYLSSSSLFRLDKETGENEAMTRAGDLSDQTVSNIYYNSDKDYLVVVYANSNIDIIRGNGHVVNMPEIKDAVMTLSKTIKDVTFAPGRIYLATDFGYVVIDDSKYVVKESHIYGTPLTSVAQVGDVLLLTTSNAAYYGNADSYYEQLSSFSTANIKTGSRIRPINDQSFFCLTGWTWWTSMTVDDQGIPHFTTKSLIENRTDLLQKTQGGFLLNVPLAGKCYITDENGLNPVGTEVGQELCSCNPDGTDDTWWAAGPNGLHQLGSESYYKPNAMSMSNPFWMTYNKSKDLLYVSTSAANALVGTAFPTKINTYDGMKWTDVTPEGAPEHGSFWIEFLPDEPNTYFLGTWKNGLLKVVDNEIVLTYDATNSPLRKKSGAMHPVTTIDRYGNVWALQSLENPEHPAMVLPVAKAKLNVANADDWMTPSIDGINTDHTARNVALSTRNGNYDIKMCTDGDFEQPIVFWNNGGELQSRPPQVQFNQFTDQDGLPYTWTNILCLTEDLTGLVWMGSTEGVISFNPAQAFSGDFRVNHIKVPRNDGTDMADYLLSGLQVNDIAVDGANRKWIATQSSGLFLVSADGTQIIKKFNTTNSALTSNTVFQVCCNPNSNSVYVTTPSGLYEYFSDSSPAETSYDNIYAYPNPVRPDYGGDVTIMGLMDNSLVKIADAGGNVIRQLKSTGGMVTWDCCDQYGDRVKTGIYMVLCSRANGGSESVVTKIAVVR